jgi:transposase
LARTEISARICRDLVSRIRELTAAVDGLEREILQLTRALAPALMDLAGCGHLTAAKIVAETAGVSRFRSRAAFANHSGTAPIPVWSGNTVRHRRNRGGNRQLNLAFHRIAITQIRLAGPGRDYLAKRMLAGDTKPKRSGRSGDGSATRSFGVSRSTKTCDATVRARRRQPLDTGARDGVGDRPTLSGGAVMS